jgi:hypothetical protein
MRSGPNRQPKRHSRLRAGLFVVAGLLALLTIGLGTAFAEGEEEGGGPVDPVIVPEVEVPPVTNPVTIPSEPASTPVTSSPAPVTRTESAPVSSGGSRTSSPSPSTRGSSGGSKTTPTQTNHGLTDSSGNAGSGGNSGGSTGSSGGGSTTSAPTGSTSPSSTTTTERSTDSVEKAAAALAQSAGHASGGDKKAQQNAVKHLGEAVGKALLGNGVSVAKPKPHNDGVADFVPLPGKNKTLYFLLILVVLAIASFVVWTQFRGPRESRRRKAHIDHRTTGAPRLTPAERVRARQWSTEHTRRTRPARRKAA